MRKNTKELSTKELNNLFGGKCIRRIIIKRKITPDDTKSSSVKFNL